MPMIVIVVVVAVTMVIVMVMVTVTCVIVMMIMRVVVMVMIMTMMMIVRVVVMSRGIGAALGVERRFNGDDLRAKPVRHLFDDMVAADAQRAAGQFDRQMTIAEMPGDARERHSVLAPDFGKRLRRGDDFDNAPVLEREPVAGAQHHRFRQIEKELEAAHACHRQPAAITVVVVEHNGVGGGPGPRAGGTNGVRCEHGGKWLKLVGTSSSIQALARAVIPAKAGMTRGGMTALIA
jgi:hypothetical protein